MQGKLATLMLTGLLAAPLAHAEGNYAGAFYGQVESEDIETGNLGVLIGTTQPSGLGFEAFYTFTIDEDELSEGPFTAEASIDAFGLFATYTVGDDFYVRGRAGYARVELEFDFEGLGSVDDDTSDFAYGIGAGIRTANGALEFTYLVLPEFDEFLGIDVDADVDWISIGYNFNF